MSETSQAILNHLLFHKSLISEQDGGERINRYLSMLREVDQGLHVAVRDPFEKSVVAAFELVLERQMDPWEIDLMEFTKLFLNKVRKDGVVNFVTAGKLVFLAWSILKLQSDKVLLAAQPPEAEGPGDGWDLDLYRDPEDLDYNQLILDGAKMPLNEAIRREGRRAVTLMELMDAFDEARREAEIQVQLNALREQAIKRFAPNFHQKVHGEDLTEDIGLTWGRLTQFNGDPIPLRALVAGSVWDEVTVFMALLFLAQLQKVKLWQKEFPHGEIFVKRLSTEETIPADELLAIPALAHGKPEAVRASSPGVGA
ncbi:MAG TPA: segregation/condensation protein A [Thermoplasmata archaeon]|nr:segregation/condensation protein A [Thermoplasmata archaeon]